MFTAIDVIGAVGRKSRWEFPSGSCAFFVALNDEWGWKGYYRETEYDVPDYLGRDYNYEVSKRAADVGLGPQVENTLDVVLWGVEIKGFIVQRAITVNDLSKRNRIVTANFLNLRDNLMNELDRAGLGSDDLGFHNCGFIKGSGKLLAIDFSHSGS